MTATTPTTTRRTLVILVLGALALTAGLTAQSKPAITRADYGQWETLAVGGGGRGGGGGGFCLTASGSPTGSTARAAATSCA